MLLDEVTAGLPSWATQSAGVTAARVAPVAGYIQIQDLAHPWVVIEWPADEPLPFGWIALSQVRQDYAPGVQFPPGAPRVDVAPLSGYADTLARLSAERAVFGADARRQREERAKAAGLERLAGRVTPGAESPFGRPRLPRNPRAARRPRQPRFPRPPRPPRAPRAAGTKGTKWGAWCRPVKPECWFSQGPCVAWPLGEKINPFIPANCAGSVMPTCSGCAAQGCTSANAWLLKPILKLLPKEWTAQPVAERVESRSRPGFRGPLALTPRFPTVPGALPPVVVAPPTVDPRATGGGCLGYDWPGYVICPDCKGSSKCRCVGPCIAIAPGSGSCLA